MWMKERKSDKWAAPVAPVGLSVSQPTIEATCGLEFSLQFETLPSLLYGTPAFEHGLACCWNAKFETVKRRENLVSSPERYRFMHRSWSKLTPVLSVKFFIFFPDMRSFNPQCTSCRGSGRWEVGDGVDCPRTALHQNAEPSEFILVLDRTCQFIRRKLINQLGVTWNLYLIFFLMSWSQILQTNSGKRCKYRR